MTINLQFEGSSSTALALQDELSELEGRPTIAYVDDETLGRVTGVEVAFGAAILYGGALMANHLVDIIYRIHRRFRPFSVLDLTGDEPILTVIEDAPGHRGEFVIKTREGEQAILIDGPDVPRADLAAFIKNFVPGAGD